MASMKDALGDDLFSITPPPVKAPAVEDDIPADVSALFERFAFEIKRQGFAHYSARAILHRIRWHYHIERGDREFACNNNWTARMARRLMAKYPELDGFFETRERKS